ncbi:DUF2585 family protein [Caenibius sp. WL]|uniref:DUF2585 family protein n=1 Tax=Caenibius sp. WL TaxID=2872646 RepID=UPI001E7AEEAF|nr:DUF2585 family protein [Caenibius sp. WL]QZP08863.1 DUF2585 family protein [Caenibius sp. WL]
MPHRRAIVATAVVCLLVLGILLAMGRPPICACGTVKLWHGVVQSAENSQHIADWYSASHVIHGLLFYFFAWVLWVRWRLFGGVPARYALPIAAAFEAFWEILENSPMIIERYRAVTVSFGYVGDSIVNSLSDIGWMVIGFLLASRLPVWVSVALALALELATLILIRDNLTLNVLMLVWPMDSVRQWQALGG